MVQVILTLLQDQWALCLLAALAALVNQHHQVIHLAQLVQWNLEVLLVQMVLCLLVHQLVLMVQLIHLVLLVLGVLVVPVNLDLQLAQLDQLVLCHQAIQKDLESQLSLEVPCHH